MEPMPANDAGPVPWLDDDEQAAWRAYLDLRDELAIRLERDLQSTSGLSSADYQVLVHLSEATDAQARPVELCRVLRWEQSRLSHQLSRMERRELILRRSCEEDGRGSVIVLTTEGRDAIVAAAPAHVRTIRRLLVDVLGPVEIRELGRLARKVLDALPEEQVRTKRSASAPGAPSTQRPGR